ncbi:MAG: glycoside hydrolase family 3 N-terminal domain-containing protein [Saprospiraceae bacterium]|nr:glycoside hydrolase family 3 N-terminal domain-containing protein [Saprospiraceae bacterium]
MRSTILVLAVVVSTVLKAQKAPDFLSQHNKEWVENTLKNMTIDQKIGQILMPRGNYSGKGYDAQKLLKWVKDYHLGGIVFFAGQPTVQAQITNDLQAASKIPLFIGEDFEWGVAMRLDSCVRFPYQMALGAMSGNEDLIERMGQEVGRQCNRLGVHINYAPVVDVNNNPNNPVINFRSFGENKINVTRKALAYMRGMQSQKLITSAKHFPGHGDTGVDSHFDVPLIAHDRKRLHDIELYPYKELIKNGLSGIMTAHLAIPALDNTPNLASTMSPKIITDLLKKELGFRGLVFTDAMDMEGAVKYFPKGEAIVRAILAGNDVIETFADVPTAFNAIKKAVTEGRITEGVLDTKIRKILMAKSYIGLDKYKPIKLERLVQDLNPIESDLLNRLFAESFLTLVKNQNDILPIKDLTQRIAVVSIDANGETPFQRMSANYTTTDAFSIPINATDLAIQNVVKSTQNHDIIIIGVNLQNIRPGAKYAVTESNQKAIAALTKSGKAVVVIFGNPYTLDKFEGLNDAKAVVMAYQLSNYTEEAAAQAVFGGIGCEGKLPVSVNKNYPVGMGIVTKSIGRLAYGTPEVVGIDSRVLIRGIDSVVQVGLREKAYPGAVVQVAKDGRVIYQKNYGFHTYEDAEKASVNGWVASLGQYAKDNKNDVMDEKVKATITNPASTLPNPKNTEGVVKLTDLYDLASVTKITTSALAVMQNMSENKFDLDKKFAEYYPDFANSNKANLKFKDMLTHKSGLRAWIPFWQNCVDSLETVKNSAIFKTKYAEKFKLGFFQRLFGGEHKFDYKVAQAIRTDKKMWQACYTPQSIKWLPNTMSNVQSTDFPVQITDNLWLHKNYRETIFKDIKESPLKPEQGYVYSDLHYYTYPSLFAKLTDVEWETYLKKTYTALGANTLTYNPLRFYSKAQIVPTEYDSFFRKSLIHGRVHDEGAALLNGISGHAGLFGNANDLMKLMQMYLQKGSYGGKQFIKPEVVDNCTKYQFPELKNRRGIAFDKLDFDKKVSNGPRSASESSFGHSGFTGTFTWIDPKYNLVYVFLSNRVYPTRENGKIGTLNIRTQVGEVIYRSLNR